MFSSATQSHSILSVLSRML